VKSHGGEINVKLLPGKTDGGEGGTVFTIELPA